MSNYIKTTNFTAKDSLPSGNPSKIVRGTEIDAEFDAIAVASATKLNALNPVMTGTLTVGSATLSEAELEILDGATVTTTELNYVDGVTSSIQTQLNNKLSLSGGAMTGAITTNSTFDGVDVAVRDGVLTSTTTTANSALPKAGGAMTGAITTNSTFDGRDVATDGTKLDGIEASADVTDTTNVVAALSTGTGISLSAGGEIGNTAPDQTVALTGAGGTTISGTYPSFTITSSSFALPAATSTALGGVELFSDTDQSVAANAVTTTAARTYGIQLNSDDQAVINVPWTDTTYTVGDGGLTEINFTSADNTKLDGIEASADVTDTTNVVASLTAGSNITIAADGTIASTSSGGIAGVTAGDGLSGGGTSGTVTVDVDNTVVRTTGAQSIGGQKNFNNVVRITGSETSNSPQLRLTAGGVGLNAIVQFGDSGDFDVGKILYANNGNTMQFYTQTAEHMRISQSGDLLIGKTAQNVTTDGIELHDGGGIYNSFITNGYTGGIEIRNRYSTGSKLDVSANGTQSRLAATNRSNSTGQSLSINGGASGTYATFTNQQRLGIGITAPTQALHVVGDIVATGNITANFSDERLKDFKGTIFNALDKVNQLNGYYYTPNETALALGVDYNGVEVGVSAQEVEAVLPEIIADSVVGKNYKTVMYERLTPLLIEAVKELTEKVEKLELKLTEMEK
jgi:hypothetical protein